MVGGGAVIWSTDCRVRWCAIQSKALLSAPVSLAVPDGDDKVGFETDRISQEDDFREK